MPVFTAFRCLHKDRIGILTNITVFGSLERCNRDDNGAGECATVAEGRQRWQRVSAGVTESGTVPTGLGRYFTVITPLQTLEFRRRPFGTVLDVIFLNNRKLKQIKGGNV